MLLLAIICAVFLIFLGVVLGCLAIRWRNVQIWLLSYLKHQLSLFFSRNDGELRHIIFCFVDHFEPKWGNPPKMREQERVDTWVMGYPRLTNQHVDGDGKCPQHTRFYPEEEYDYEYLEKLSALCRRGYGEIELHLHHSNDTSEGLRERLRRALRNFGRHGALETSENPPRVAYGFIHGNWALDNSQRDGMFCGVNDELRILGTTGCYADFGLPSAPSSCQTKKINSIYYATDDPERPKSHDSGVDVEVGKACDADLIIIQGPLTLDWTRRKFGIFPRIENGEVSGRNPGTEDRVDLWVKQGIHVRGRRDWVFVKVHCHGAQERDHDALLGEDAERLYRYLEREYNDGVRFKLHYVTARECYNIVKAAEAGENGDPNDYRDYCIRRYRNSISPL